MSTERLRHGKLEIALHALREGAGRPLLWLHGLGERAPRGAPEPTAAWPGPVWALDFTGHGDSDCPVGGGYSAELLMGDADAALRRLGSATLLGRGLGAWVALLLAGARPAEVRGAILCDGPGLPGGGPAPATPVVVFPETRLGAPDAFALLELARDPRPPDYAMSFLRQANELSGLDRPLRVCCRERPEWIRALEQDPGVERCLVAEALDRYKRV